MSLKENNSRSKSSSKRHKRRIKNTTVFYNTSILDHQPDISTHNEIKQEAILYQEGLWDNVIRALEEG